MNINDKGLRLDLRNDRIRGNNLLGNKLIRFILIKLMFL